jgi:hypothetical protein
MSSIRFSHVSAQSFGCRSANVRSPHPSPSPAGEGRPQSVAENQKMD